MKERHGERRDRRGDENRFNSLIVCFPVSLSILEIGRAHV